jgi:DNA-binding XRE family transcriptional regulator
LSRKYIGKLGRLLNNEALFIYRRRARETQAQAAERLGCTRAMYGETERGDNAVPVDENMSLAEHELCVLYRRRAKASQSELAQYVQCSRYWIHLMETGKADCTILLWYWEQ